MPYLRRALVLLVVPVLLVLALPWVLRSLPTRPQANLVPATAPWLLVPASFGEHGYYRGDNVHEWTRLPAQFTADNSACATCHQPLARIWAQGAHQGISCQTCHGAGSAYIQGKVISAPVGEPAGGLCQLCHDAKVVGRPADFPQVIPSTHSGGVDCTLCHNPHSPRLGDRQ